MQSPEQRISVCIYQKSESINFSCCRWDAVCDALGEGTSSLLVSRIIDYF